MRYFWDGLGWLEGEITEYMPDMPHVPEEDPINFEIAFDDDDAAQVVLARDNYSVARDSRRANVWHLIIERDDD